MRGADVNLGHPVPSATDSPLLEASVHLRRCSLWSCASAFLALAVARHAARRAVPPSATAVRDQPDLAVRRQGPRRRRAPGDGGVGQSDRERGGTRHPRRPEATRWMRPWRWASRSPWSTPKPGTSVAAGSWCSGWPMASIAALDYREAAPGPASHDMYLDRAGDPTGTVGQGRSRRRSPRIGRGTGRGASPSSGSCRSHQVIEPAIQLASEGFVVDELPQQLDR